MRMATAVWLLNATSAIAQAMPPPPSAVSQDDARPSRRGGGGGVEATPLRPDISDNFDPFAPDDTPPPRPAPFDPARPSLAADPDPLAALIRNGQTGAILPSSQSPEPWMLPGTRRKPTLADPPPGSAPATKSFKPSAPEG